jgi:hypothetical protein
VAQRPKHDGALRHGQEIFAVGRVAGFDQTALAGGRVELGAIVNVAAAFGTSLTPNRPWRTESGPGGPSLARSDLGTIIHWTGAGTGLARISDRGLRRA